MTPIALVHGGGFDSRCWELLVPHLTVASVAVDLPGRGSRPGPLDSVTFADCARAIADDVAAAGFDDVVLAVHSLGGCSVAPALRLLGDRVRHVVFIAAVVPAHGNGTHQEWSTELRRSIEEDAMRDEQTMPLARVKML